MRVGELMTTDPVTTTVDTPLKEAARLMLTHRISGLPVVDAAGTLIGIVTEGDIVHQESAKPVETSLGCFARKRPLFLRPTYTADDLRLGLTRHRGRRPDLAMARPASNQEAEHPEDHQRAIGLAAFV